MKNKLNFILLLIVCFLTINIVEAKEGPFILDWQTEENENVLASLNAPYRNGYATVDYDIEKSVIKTYDMDGKVLKTYDTERKILDLKTEGNDLYTLEVQLNYSMFKDEELYEFRAPNPSSQNTGTVGMEKIPYEYYIVLYNENLDKVQEQRIELIDDISPSYFYSNDLFGIYVTGDQVKLSVFAGIISFDRTLSNMSIINMDNPDNISEFKDILPVIDTEVVMEGIWPSSIINFDHNDDYSVISTSEECYLSKKDCSLSQAELILLSNDGEVVWNKEYQENSIIRDVAISNNYIIVSISEDDQSRIEVYDLEGNLVQTITTNLYYHYIHKTPSGFITSNTIPLSIIPLYFLRETRSSSPDTNNQVGDLKPADSPIPFMTNHQIYYLPRTIKTVVKSGEGTVDVLSIPRVNSEITFEVHPKEGYEVFGITVTNSKGETITFTQNVFTMPDDDVTIEVEFARRVLNPETKDIAIITLLLVTFITAILFRIQYKKFKFLQ